MSKCALKLHSKNKADTVCDFEGIAKAKNSSKSEIVISNAILNGPRAATHFGNAKYYENVLFAPKDVAAVKLRNEDNDILLGDTVLEKNNSTAQMV